MWRRAHLLLWLACLLAGACGGNKSISDSGGATQGSPAPAAEQKPQRIISLSPNTTEVLHGVGAFGRVVAVSDYCTFPPEVESLPRLGGWQNTNLERVASLRPDLVVMADAQAPFVKERFDALGLRTLVVPSSSLADAFTAIDLIGRATGEEEAARALAEQTRREIEEVRALTRDLPRRRVLCVVDRVPGTLRDLYSATRGSFLAELIEAAGGESIAPPSSSGWGKVSKEAVVALQPEVIIDLMMQESGGRLAEDTQAVWRELPQLRAVRDARVYPLRDPSVLHPSQFVGQTARRFAEIIHPEAFAADSTGGAR